MTCPVFQNHAPPVPWCQYVVENRDGVPYCYGCGATVAEIEEAGEQSQ